MDQTKFKLGELFCGPGGLACGAMRSQSDDGRFGIVHAWANDYDEDTCKTYTKNISKIAITSCTLLLHTTPVV